MTAKSTPRRPLVCCKAWTDTDLERRAAWRYQAIHELGHSRVPFSLEKLAFLTNLELPEAKTLLKEAQTLKWIRYAPDGHLWVGNLSGKR